MQDVKLYLVESYFLYRIFGLFRVTADEYSNQECWNKSNMKNNKINKVKTHYLKMSLLYNITIITVSRFHIPASSFSLTFALRKMHGSIDFYSTGNNLSSLGW